jgi:PAS domain S-box-containing protein
MTNNPPRKKTTTTARKITKSKQSEKTLKESEERYRLFFNNISDPVFVQELSVETNTPGKFIELNEIAGSYLGYNREELLEMIVTQIDAPETLSNGPNILKRLLAEGHLTWEGIHISKDGRRIPVEISNKIFRLHGKTMIMATARDITDRRQTEKELRQSEELFRTDFDRAPVGRCLVSMEGRFFKVNKTWCNMLGYSESELLSKTFREVTHPDDLEQGNEWVRKLIAGSATHMDLEKRYLHKSGYVVWGVVRAILLHNDSGSPLFFSTYIQDITERKQAEEKITMLSSVVEQSTEGMAIADLEGNLIFINKAWCEMHGYKSPEELLGKSLAISHNQEQLENEVKPFNKKVMELGAYSGEVGHITKDGKAFPTLMTTTLLKDKQGKPYALAGIARDINERKKAEEALHTSEEKYRLLFENASDAIFVAQDEKIIFPNPQLSRLLGYSYEELNGTLFRKFIYPGDADMVVERHRQRLKGDYVPSIYSFRALTKSGEILWVEVSKVLITWEGRPATLSFLRDITQQKKMEEQLHHAQKMEAIGTLAGGVAHDFNNLLMGILGYTSLMLMKTEKTHPFYEKLKIIEKQVESGAQLTKQLLGFARGGKYEVKPVNVNDLIIKTADIFGRTKKEITIHKKLEEDLHTIEADTGQIEQVLFNLYVNAWQAMPSGGSLYLETQNVKLDEQQCRTYNAKPGPYVKITVTDTGIGMDARTKKRIFEPFFTTKDVGKGTGLGLASAYGIISNHGGIINVYSEKGHGTTFTLYLPASGAKSAEAKPAEGSLLTGHETILIVDDEPTNIEAVKELLEALGYKILTAQSGKKAIEIYKKHLGKIQLVILDMIMPEMNGKETLVKLMEIDKNVRILLSSGYSINSEAKTILELGCRGFIQKPFRIEELSRKIRDVLICRDL